MKWLRSALRLIDSISEGTAKTVRWLVLITMSITVYDVVMRYFFHSPTPWAYELAGLLLGPFWLLGGGYVLLHDDHVRLDMFYRRLTPRGQAIVDVVTYPLFFFYCILILVGGCDYFWFSFTRFEITPSVWGPPVWPFKVAVPLGAALILLQGIARYIRSCYMVATGRALV